LVINIRILKILNFFIEDKGPGVPEEFRDEIFCKFSQIDEKFEGRVYTTGLGLNFCKKAVKCSWRDDIS